MQQFRGMGGFVVLIVMEKLCDSYIPPWGLILHIGIGRSYWA